MGELIIHIDQSSGAVLKVEQKLDRYQKQKLAKLMENQDSAKDKTQSYSLKGITQERIDRGVVALEPSEASLYNGPPEKVQELLEHRDKFDRIITLPLELWEMKGQTVCSINCGGVIYRCIH